VSIMDTRTSAQWGHFGLCAAALGIRSVVFEPVNAGLADVTVGFYGTEPYAFDGGDLALIARQAGTVVQEADRYHELARSVHTFRAGLDSRSIIDQAAGIIMAERSCSPEAALAELRSRSNHENQKLADVARDLVSGQSSG
jgi:ANTAR domain